MTTSGTITSALSASDLVTLAMKELGLVASGETPTGDELNDGLTALNWMLKSWQSRGLVSWRDTDGSVSFPANTASMVLSPYCLDVVDARLVQAVGYERPLQRWERAQYRQLPNKSTLGFPAAYMVAKTNGAITMYLWPVPTATMTVKYGYARVIEDVTDGAQTIDVPQEWQEVAMLGLAVRLASMFGVSRLDPAAVGLIGQRAAALEQLLLDQDRPASIFMGSSYSRNF